MGLIFLSEALDFLLLVFVLLPLEALIVGFRVFLDISGERPEVLRSIPFAGEHFALCVASRFIEGIEQLIDGSELFAFRELQKLLGG